MPGPKSPIVLGAVLLMVLAIGLVAFQWTSDLRGSERTLLWIALLAAGILGAGYALKKNL